MNKLLRVLLLCLLLGFGVQSAFAKSEIIFEENIDAQLRTKMQTMLSICPETITHKLLDENISKNIYPNSVSSYIDGIKNLLEDSEDIKPKNSGECRLALLNLGESLVQEYYDINDFISDTDNSATIFKKHPKILLDSLDFAYAVGEENSLNIQKEYLNRGERFVQELKSADKELNCAVDASLFYQYIFSKTNFKAGTFEQRMNREKDIWERAVHWGESLESCSFPYPNNAFVSARFIEAQSRLSLVKGAMLDELSKEESAQQNALINSYATQWIQKYSEQMGCKKILSNNEKIKYENDKQFFMGNEKWFACFYALDTGISKNLIFGYDHDASEAYKKLIWSDSKTDVLEFAQDCESLLKITPNSFGEKQNYSAFRTLIEPACQK